MNTVLIILLVIGVLGALYYLFCAEHLVGKLTSFWRKASGLTYKSIRVGSENWHYLEGGPEGAEPLVLIHGFGADKDGWLIYARLLVKDYRVIIPDMPGFGDTERDMNKNYRLHTQVERLHAFLAELGVQHFHLAGNSMGGNIAGLYALTFAEQVKSLALFCNAGVKSEQPSELEEKIEKGVNPLVVGTLEEYEDLLEFVTYKPLWLPGIVKRVKFAESLENYEFLDWAFWGLVEDILGDDLSSQLTHRLHAISMPTLVLWGQHDRLVHVSCAEVMRREIPNNKTVIFEDAGHVPMLEKPQETAALHVELMQSAA